MASGVSGVLVGRGVLRNPWILAQAADLAAGRAPARGHAGASAGSSCCDYIELLLDERVDEARRLPPRRARALRLPAAGARRAAASAG